MPTRDEIKALYEWLTAGELPRVLYANDKVRVVAKRSEVNSVRLLTEDAGGTDSMGVMRWSPKSDVATLTESAVVTHFDGDLLICIAQQARQIDESERKEFLCPQCGPYARSRFVTEAMNLASIVGHYIRCHPHVGEEHHLSMQVALGNLRWAIREPDTEATR